MKQIQQYGCFVFDILVCGVVVVDAAAAVAVTVATAVAVAVAGGIRVDVV